MSRWSVAFTFLALFAVVSVPGVVAAQDESPQLDSTLDGAGIGLTANTSDSAVGLNLPIQFSDHFRFEPNVLFGISGGTATVTNMVSPSETTTTTTTTTAVGPSLSFLGTSGGHSGARLLLGLEVAALFAIARSTTTGTNLFGGDYQESSTDFAGVTIGARPVFGGEVSVTNNVTVGVRVGPSLETFVPSGGGGAVFNVGGFGRLDAFYDFCVVGPCGEVSSPPAPSPDEGESHREPTEERNEDMSDEDTSDDVESPKQSAQCYKWQSNYEECVKESGGNP